MDRPASDYLHELGHWRAEEHDQHWALVRHFIDESGPQAALATARLWCASADADTRCAGLDVFGELGQSDPDLITELLEFVRPAVLSDNCEVRWSAAVAMRYISDDRAAAVFLDLLFDPDDDVRCQAVYGLPLPHQDDLPEDHPVVQGLLRAMEDPVDTVRDWATFGLGQLSSDTPAIREALVRRVADPHEDTACEAIVALADRKDPRVVAILQDWLSRREVCNLVVEAAECIADPRLLPALLALKSQGWLVQGQETLLDDAIAACSVPAD